MLMPPSEWPLKTIAVRIFAYVHPPTPLQTRHKISDVTGPKFTKFLQDVEGTSRVSVWV